MKKYISPEIEAVLLNSADCITLSPADYDNAKDEIEFDDFFA